MIVKLFTMEGRYTKLFGIHFMLLNHFKGSYRINLPYFLFHSLDAFIRKNKRAIPIHQGLIKVLVDFVNVSARSIRLLYQQMSISPLLDPTPDDILSREAHRSPSLPKEIASPQS